MSPPLCIALAAGEPSGDRLGALLIRRIRQQHPQACFVGVAGPEMRAAGCEALAPSEALAVMGLAEVLQHLPALVRLRARLARQLIARAPQVFVGIDAPDFNLGLEKRLRGRAIPTLHWVSPAVWAWRRYRLKKIRACADEVLTLFPFETKFYHEQGVAARFVGHPLADEIDPDCARDATRQTLALGPHQPCLALLPGSRASEVSRLLPLFLHTASRCSSQLPGLQLVLPAATPALFDHCRDLLRRAQFAHLDVKLLEGRAREAMCAADLVLLASGTATLECLLLRRPMVVAYRMHGLSYRLIRALLRVPDVALPNILLGRRQVPEFLQDDANPAALAAAVLELLQTPALMGKQIAPFAALHQQLRRDSIEQVARRVLDHALRHRGL